MPTGTHWIQFIYIHLAFFFLLFGIIILTQIKKIRQDWPLYRCNPLYMPLSENIETDFVYCVQNIQYNFMGYLLQPITFIINALGSVLLDFMNDINSVRGMFDYLRFSIGNIVNGIFGVFSNLVIEFQRVTIAIKDLTAKTTGILVTMMYIMDGTNDELQALWNGPPGKLMRSLEGLMGAIRKFIRLFGI
jgi:hypothetical protein